MLLEYVASKKPLECLRFVKLARHRNISKSEMTKSMKKKSDFIIDIDCKYNKPFIYWTAKSLEMC